MSFVVREALILIRVHPQFICVQMFFMLCLKHCLRCLGHRIDQFDRDIAP